jgi:hypothetical protein
VDMTWPTLFDRIAIGFGVVGLLLIIWCVW